jgi:hypothetical protein
VSVHERLDHLTDERLGYEKQPGRPQQHGPAGIDGCSKNEGKNG